jgi:hypothetical protein
MISYIGNNVCPSGTVRDEAGTCIGIVSCPSGMALDPVSMTCKTIGTFDCPPGTIFDTNLQKCVGMRQASFLLIGAIALMLIMGKK